jgi:cytochrome P450
MHRDPRFWERPDDFRPERWDENSGKKEPKYAYFPYGGGPRFCMGYAYTEMLSVLVLAMVMRKFGFEAQPGETIDPVPTAALVPKNGISLKLIERSKCSAA